MDPWTGVSLALALVILVFTSIIVGLIRHNVLLSTDCCLQDTPCAAILQEQRAIYYDPITGLQVRYILATVFLAGSLILRLQLPPLNFEYVANALLPLQNPIFLAIMALFTFTLQLLFADLTLHNLADSPVGLASDCSITSFILVGAINVLAWFCLVLDCILFFLFIISQNTIHHYIPVLRFTKSDVDGEEEVVMFGDPTGQIGTRL